MGYTGVEGVSATKAPRREKSWAKTSLVGCATIPSLRVVDKVVARRARIAGFCLTITLWCSKSSVWRSETLLVSRSPTKRFRQTAKPVLSEEQLGLRHDVAGRWGTPKQPHSSACFVLASSFA